MGKRIGLYIGGRRFDVDVDDKFAHYLEAQMKIDFNVEGNNEVKSVMQAYVRKSYELYKQNQKIEEIIEEMQ